MGLKMKVRETRSRQALNWGSNQLTYMNPMPMFLYLLFP